MNASVTYPFTELPTERQKPYGMPGIGFGVFDADDSGFVGQIRGAFDRDPIDALRCVERPGFKPLQQRRLDDALLPRGRIAGRIERRPTCERR